MAPGEAKLGLNIRCSPTTVFIPTAIIWPTGVLPAPCYLPPLNHALPCCTLPPLQKRLAKEAKELERLEKQAAKVGSAQQGGRVGGGGARALG